MRMEFVFASHVRVHPLALTRYETLPKEVRRQVDEATEGYQDKRAYFVERLSEGIALIAAAFYPRPVLLRFSDFKTNEYARLIGGHLFEPKEENPMLGWRGRAATTTQTIKRASCWRWRRCGGCGRRWASRTSWSWCPSAARPRRGRRS